MDSSTHGIKIKTMKPKKVYFSHNLDGTMKTTLSGKRFNQSDAEFISVEWLKEWIEEYEMQMRSRNVVDSAKLLTAIEKP